MDKVQNEPSGQVTLETSDPVSNPDEAVVINEHVDDEDVTSANKVIEINDLAKLDVDKVVNEIEISQQVVLLTELNAKNTINETGNSNHIIIDNLEKSVELPEKVSVEHVDDEIPSNVDGQTASKVVELVIHDRPSISPVNSELKLSVAQISSTDDSDISSEFEIIHATETKTVNTLPIDNEPSSSDAEQVVVEVAVTAIDQPSPTVNCAVAEVIDNHPVSPLGDASTTVSEPQTSNVIREVIDCKSIPLMRRFHQIPTVLASIDRLIGGRPRCSKKYASPRPVVDDLRINGEVLLIIKLLTLNSTERNQYTRNLCIIRGLCDSHGKLASCYICSFNEIKKWRDNDGKCDNFWGSIQFNEENFLLMELIQMDTNKRLDNLLKLAQKRHIIYTPGDNVYVVHPNIKNLRSALSTDQFIYKIDNFARTILPELNSEFVEPGTSCEVPVSGDMPCMTELKYLDRVTQRQLTKEKKRLGSESKEEAKGVMSKGMLSSVAKKGQASNLVIPSQEEKCSSVDKALPLFKEPSISNLMKENRRSSLPDTIRDKRDRYSNKGAACNLPGNQVPGSFTSFNEETISLSRRASESKGFPITSNKEIAELKIEIRNVNSRLSAKLSKEIEKCNALQGQSTRYQDEEEEVKRTARDRTKRKRGSKRNNKSSRDSSLATSNADSILTTAANNHKMPQRQLTDKQPLMALLEEINRKIDLINLSDLDAGDESMDYVKVVAAKMNMLDSKLRDKRLILNKKARKAKKLSAAAIAEQKTPKFRDEVNRLFYEVTGRYIPMLPTFKTQNEMILYDVPDNIKLIDKFVEQLLAKQLGMVVEGDIRINAFNTSQAYISGVPQTCNDVLIRSILLRQCAMHGDIVQAFVFLPTNRPNPVGFVTRILKRTNDRQVIGHCAINKNKNYVVFFPTTKRVPRIKIFKNTLKDINLDEQILYLAKIIEWEDDIPHGQILEVIGDRNTLTACNKAILLDNKLEIPHFSESILKSLPSDSFTIPVEEYDTRENLTNECVFTIDPATARDLDDAVSCKRLANGNFEIGVHISDVTYFLKEFSELDEIVREQATSIYMVDAVYHMLPRSLCMTCSLLPGEDKLAFSVFWEMTSDSRVVSTRFAKTIINSCVQLAYEHAQMMIEKPNNEWQTTDNLPPITKSFTVHDLSVRVNILHRLAVQLRKKRFDNLCIKIDQPKVTFQLDPDTGEPIGYAGYKQMEANSLIEEFMLLANQTVATMIYTRFPNNSILRNHAPPKKSGLESLATRLKQLNFNIDLSTSRTISESFIRLVSDPHITEGQSCVLNELLAKPMNRAEYFCSEIAKDRKEYLWHFALSIPIYTHFTSPIRRYPDIMVHRALAAALNVGPMPQRIPSDLQTISTRCNVQKYNAKLAGEESSKLYFMQYVKNKGVLEVKAVVMDLLTADTFEVMLMETGYKVKINLGDHKPKIQMEVLKSIPISGLLFYVETGMPVGVQYKVQIFAELTVSLAVNGENKLKGTMVLPQKI